MKPLDIWKGKNNGPEQEQNDGHAKGVKTLFPALYLSTYYITGRTKVQFN